MFGMISKDFLAGANSAKGAGAPAVTLGPPPDRRLEFLARGLELHWRGGVILLAGSPLAIVVVPDGRPAIEASRDGLPVDFVVTFRAGHVPAFFMSATTIGFVDMARARTVSGRSGG